MAPPKGRGALNRRGTRGPRTGAKKDGQNLLENYTRATNKLLRSFHINPDRIVGVDEFTSMLIVMFYSLVVFFAFYMGSLGSPRDSMLFLGDPGSGAEDYFTGLRNVNITQYPAYVSLGHVPSCLKFESIQEPVEEDLRPFNLLRPEILSDEEKESEVQPPRDPVFPYVSSRVSTYNFSFAKNYEGDADPELLVLLSRDNPRSAEDVYRALRAGLIHSVCSGPEGYRIALAFGGPRDGLRDLVRKRYANLNNTQILEIIPSQEFGRLLFVGERDDFLESAICPACTRSALSGVFASLFRRLAGLVRDSQQDDSSVVLGLLDSGLVDEPLSPEVALSPDSRNPFFGNPMFHTLTTYGGNMGPEIKAPREAFRLSDDSLSYLERYAGLYASSFKKQFQAILKACWRVQRRLLSDQTMKDKFLSLAAPGASAWRPVYHFSTITGQTVAVSPFVVFLCAVLAAVMLAADVLLFQRRRWLELSLRLISSFCEQFLAASVLYLVLWACSCILYLLEIDCLSFFEGSRKTLYWAILLCAATVAIDLASAFRLCGLDLSTLTLRLIRVCQDWRLRRAEAKRGESQGEGSSDRRRLPRTPSPTATKATSSGPSFYRQTSALLLIIASFICLREGRLFSGILVQGAFVFSAAALLTDFVSARKLVSGKWFKHAIFICTSVLLTFPTLYLQGSALMEEVAVWLGSGQSMPSSTMAIQAFFCLSIVIGMSLSLFYHDVAAYVATGSGRLICIIGGTIAAFVLFIANCAHSTTSLVVGNLIGDSNVANVPTLSYQSKLSLYCMGAEVGKGLCYVRLDGGVPTDAAVDGTLQSDSGVEGAAESSWGHTLSLFSNNTQIYVPAFDEVTETAETAGAAEAAEAAEAADTGDENKEKKLLTRRIESFVDCSGSGECVATADCVALDFENGRQVEVAKGSEIPGYRRAHEVEKGSGTGGESKSSATPDSSLPHVIACQNVPVTVSDELLWRREVVGYLCE